MNPIRRLVAAVRSLPRNRSSVVGLLGLLVTTISAAFVLLPTLLSDSPAVVLVTAVTDRNGELVLLLLAAGVGLVSLWVARVRLGDDDDEFERVAEMPPESVVADDDAVAGQQFDDLFADASTASEWWHEEQVVSTLTTTAIDVVSLTTTREEARVAIRQGTWTDDRLAAAMLGGVEGPRPSLWSRLRKWLDPVAERERRLRRTVCAIEAAVPNDAMLDGGSR